MYHLRWPESCVGFLLHMATLTPTLCGCHSEAEEHSHAQEDGTEVGAATHSEG